ncbi:MAG: thioredoxin domain-containing protein [Candidatus Omnitrophica bacterium]|nr:thioredoxin domain-containing protein [Candidatus Omnitrophota bacterium]
MLKKLFSFTSLLLVIFSFQPPAIPQTTSQGIQWFEWGENAFEYAKKENKPILLYLTSSWCHWCYVMDVETFKDPDIIFWIRESLVPIRVNTDLRPDIHARYNMGGWPSTLFLTPEGNVVIGATFLSPAQMKNATSEIERVFKEHREEFDKKADAEIKEYGLFLKKALEEARDEDFAPSFIDKILASILINADDELGGIGKAEKSPAPEVTEFLFLIGETRPDAKARSMLQGFLEGEAKLFDAETGGFFRYASKRDWTEPQYEKILSVNALLLRDFIWSKKIFHQAQDAVRIDATVSYADEFLHDESLGGYFGSQAADLFLTATRLDRTEETAVIPGAVYYSYTKAKRLELGSPAVDRNVYTNSCAQIISVLLEAAGRLGDSGAASKALRALDFLMEVSFEPKGGMKHVFPESKKSILILEDQVWTLKALLEAFRVTGDEKYLQSVGRLLKIVEKNFGTGEGIFFDMTDDPNALGNLKKREVPLVENCLMARVYIHMARLTGKESHRNKARAILRFFAPRYQQFSHFAAAYGSALIEWFYPELSVAVIGNPKDALTEALQETVLALPSVRMDIKRLAPEIFTEAPSAVFRVGNRSLTPARTEAEIAAQFEVAQKLVETGLE